MPSLQAIDMVVRTDVHAGLELMRVSPGVNVFILGNRERPVRVDRLSAGRRSEDCPPPGAYLPFAMRRSSQTASASTRPRAMYLISGETAIRVMPFSRLAMI